MTAAALLIRAVTVLGLWAAPAPDVSPDPADGGGAEVRKALEAGGYPWYDERTGRVVPVLPEPDLESGVWKRIGDWISARLKGFSGWFRWLNGWRIPGVAGAGDLVAIGLVLLVVTLVLVGLLELLRRYKPLLGAEGNGRVVVEAGRARRIEGMPAGVRFDAADPWAEAQRLRALGDYAGAVVYLFAHQLLALERAGRLRLIPGRTGRQLVRAVADRPLRATVEPTLRLFELVYYGHRAPTAEAFEAVWSQAEAFERLLAAGAAEAVS